MSCNHKKELEVEKKSHGQPPFTRFFLGWPSVNTNFTSKIKYSPVKEKDRVRVGWTQRLKVNALNFKIKRNKKKTILKFKRFLISESITNLGTDFTIKISHYHPKERKKKEKTRFWVIVSEILRMKNQLCAKISSAHTCLWARMQMVF